MKPVRVTDPGDIFAFGPNRSNCNLRSPRGSKATILRRVGSKLDTRAIPSTWKVLMPHDTRPSHESRDILASARIGLIVIQGVIGEQNADPRPDGLEARCPRCPEYAEGGEVVWNPSEKQIPRYPCFRPES